MKIIDEHNKGYNEGRYSWFMGVNQFTDMTREEFNKLNNLKMPNAPKTDLVYEMKAKKVAKAVDWRNKVFSNSKIEDTVESYNQICYRY